MKKIKNLTLEEMLTICVKHKECRKCPLCESHSLKCICSQLYSFTNNKTFLEKEVEL